jgi:hypothetical protein
MQMNRVALMASAGLGVAFLAACSDSPTSPSKAAFVPKSSFAVGDATNATPVNTLIKICKVGDASGTFTITDVGNGSASGNPTIIDDNAGIAGNQKTLTPGTDAAPNCVVAVEDLGNATNEVGDFFTVTEATGAGVTTQTRCFLAGAGELACPAQFFINTAHGWTILVRNTAPPPPPSTGCTYTKGWYRNNGSNTIIAVDGRTIGQEQQIFDATPGKPGNVTWGDDNNNLNLYQQLLAALNNLGGNATAGPAAVDAAVAAALAATSGSGTTIVVAPGTDVSGLIDVLSAFNEGTFTGWPHCD